MDIKLLPEKAILANGNLIVADIHIGFEEAAAAEGKYIPKLLKEVISQIQAIIERERPRRVIINGDLKHSFVPLKREYVEVKTFLENITSLVNEVIVVKGNHDVGIKWIENIGAEVLDAFEIGKWKVVHGHRLEEGERFIIGHEHPAIRLRDEVGAVIKVPTFLIGKDIIVLPAFSPWAYGNDITGEIISPILRTKNINELEVHVPLENEILNFGKLGKLIEALRRLSSI
ncbi:metallophosphoesterase [Pyrococcus yayanosii]|uniref:Phosphoesterase, putative n=1 Tax=Pyrococcus yayanosii (strain CH1 / JCM 16557) TaxID=529709 RepID=F8AF14_PYRYC|nr:metallophosphoesterase [Pyrococcus yayanosii]AEH24852.1 phosphoesterase, putative [Pyrococcus yayanosii CH1]